MDKTPSGYASIDAYIADFSPEIQEKLEAVRRTVREAAPDAKEIISYQMPTFYLKGNLVHFAAFKQHIGFYPAPSGIEAFQEELAAYKGAKGSVQFPLDQPLPLELVRRITAFRVEENLAKGKKKTAAKKQEPR
jgi:uncharacterized protein YdhG (YjbR/CyaY superfamily)